jgi:phenylalanyl-tRNA synthetase beta chain
VQTDAVQAEIARIGGEVVVDVDLFDEYTPDTGKKGLAFHLEYRVPDRTLTDTEVADTHAAIEHALKKEFDAEVR